MSRPFFSVLFSGLLAVAVVAAPAAVVAAPPTASVHGPASAEPGRTVALTVRLPGDVAAIDGRVLMAPGAAELLGVAPVGGGTAFRPVEGRGGSAFGAYGLRAVGGQTIVRLVLVPLRAGELQVRVAIDAAADRLGRRLAVTGGDRLTMLRIGGGSRVLRAPLPTGRTVPSRAAGPARELFRGGRIDRRDLDGVRAGWEAARERGSICGGDALEDVNQDGCVDITDVQSMLASSGDRTSSGGTSSAGTSSDGPAATSAGRIFTVVSAADTPDAAPGNGVCADADGACTLRAAITEADYLIGEDHIAFSLPGPAPAVIQLTGRLPIISARSGGVVIDGYTQPGSRTNDASVGSNAIPGVELRGNGKRAKEVAIRITSPYNTVRGVIISNVWRGMFLDGGDAHHNTVVGNWIGFTRDQQASGGQYGIVLNTGANQNVIGTAALTDRNVIGNHGAGVDEYGPGTDGNIVQGNLFCIRPSGFTEATCSSGIDHNFGPKNGLIGGVGNERNVFGPTYLQGIELSHGYDPSKPYLTDTSTTYQINDNRVIGNWVGFRADGSFDPAFRSGLNDPGAGDNGQGINVYDGSNDNIVERNHVGSRFDGIPVMSPNALRNIVRDNIIGESPLGEPAPLTGWGVKLRIGTKSDVVVGNTIRNAAAGGVGLVQDNVYNIRITRNIVTDTAGPAIDLYGVAGPDPNDADDADSGANTLLNSPVLASATTGLVTGTAVGSARVELFRASRAAGAYGLPIEFLGATTAASDGTWSLPVALAVGDRVTALQIRPDANTSELAANVEVTAPPGPGDLLAADDFERSVSSGWGTATSGGTWTHRGSVAAFSVANGPGRSSLAAGASRESRLAVGAADVAITGNVAFDRLPSSGNAFAYVVARANGNDAYRAAIRVASSGAVYVRLKMAVGNVESNIASEVAVTDLTAAPGAPLGFRLEVVGTQLRFRVWSTTGAEPSSWLTTATDSTASLQGPGSAGLRGYVGQSVPNGPVTVSLDGFEVRRA